MTLQMSQLLVSGVWLNGFYNLPTDTPEVAYVIQLELEDPNAVADAVILLQCIAALVGQGEGLPLGSEGPQYGAFVYRDGVRPIVRLSHRTWSRETADAAHTLMTIIANRHHWRIKN